jgi:hypothetical protein
MRYWEFAGQSYAGRPLKEAPEIIEPCDFGMPSEEYRIGYTEMLLSRQPQVVLEETDTYELRRGGSYPVYFFMLEKPTQRLVYFAECETNEHVFGESITQVAVWRDDASTAVRGITERVFFEYLLWEWPMIMSDEQQTESGKSFWIRRMAIAVERGYRVGLANTREDMIDWCEGPFRPWLDAHAHAWAEHWTAQRLRFVIAK